MSLLRLLKTGRSLEGAEESVNRYRVTNQKLLPRFGVANPFPAAAGGQTKPQRREETQSSPLPVVSGGGEPKPAPCEAKSSAKKGWVAGLVGWLTGNRRVKPSPVRPQTVFRPDSKPGPVQGELLLNEVKVMRNDLTETDLEVVRVAKKPAVQGANPFGSKPSGHTKAWKRVADRLSRAKQA